MSKRRFAFATPFVLVVGCKTPAPADPGKDERTMREEAPVVVAIPEPVDAAIDHHLEEAAGLRDLVPPEDPPRSPKCCANPPPPKRLPSSEEPPYRVPPPKGNPPSPRRIAIVKYEPYDGQTVITIGAGTDDGVTKKTRTCLLDDADRCVPRVLVTLVRCDKSVCLGKVDAPIDRVKSRAAVQVTWD